LETRLQNLDGKLKLIIQKYLTGLPAKFRVEKITENLVELRNSRPAVAKVRDKNKMTLKKSNHTRRKLLLFENLIRILLMC
jgi:hypothetical protein